MAFLTLIAIFLIFTLFELLRFIATSGAGAYLVGRYMLFLLPLVMVALAPMSVLVAVLVTYALLARRSEAVAWWACGQSVYRLALPGLIFAACIGLGLWGVQERLMPRANRLQNNLRNQIRGGLSRGTQKGRNWLASPAVNGTLYSYEFDEKSRELRAPLIYEFDAQGIHLRRLLSAETARWNENGALELEQAEIIEIEGGAPLGGGLRRVARETLAGIEPPEAFKPVLNTPAEMDIKQLSVYIKALKRRGESTSVAAPLAVALERKRAEPFSPVVMALVGIPLALAFGRRSAIAALCAAVAIGLTFWGATSGFQQLGNYGLLPARIAVWSPLVIFASAGVYLLFRART
jgi:LPS export ABC transporter permease LptG